MLENQELLLCGGVPFAPADDSFDALRVLPPRRGMGLAGVAVGVRLGFDGGVATAGEVEGR